eukprot:TRINITY_DN34909_c0_g1_i1.p1 TRINITY_DN34909_c0_g1~~TRINITY_DN34909_c0_g1_i1.p1  ORF type:complete len:283 (-),score=37.76 TRINITY_DN34909_c0_g1_i1:95-943(-)
MAFSRLVAQRSFPFGNAMSSAIVRTTARQQSAFLSSSRCSFPRSSQQISLGSVRSSVTLRDLWDKPLSEAKSSSGAAMALPLPQPSSAEFRRQLENAHSWRMTRVFGDKMQATPPSAAHVFLSCGFLEGIFLCVNVGTLSPLIFEMAMPYHLKYTSLILAWWGGTYIGLNVARYGPMSQGMLVCARAVMGAVFLTAGVTGLALADGVGGMGPWPSYWLLILSYSGMAAFDLHLHRSHMIPPWLLKWKVGISGLIVASLLFGVMKGKYLEANASKLIWESDLD